MSSNLTPIWNPEKKGFTFQGRVVFSFGTDLLWDPQSLRVMTTGYMPDPETGELPGVPDPANFKVFPSTYYAEKPNYHPDDQQLIPVLRMSPLSTPTPKTQISVLSWMQFQFAELKHTLQTDPMTKEVQIVSTDPKGNWPIVINSAGQVALGLDMGRNMAAQVAAEFREAGLSV